MSDGFDRLVVLWTSGLAKRQRSLKKHMFVVVSPTSPLYTPFRGIQGWLGRRAYNVAIDSYFLDNGRQALSDEQWALGSEPRA